MKDIQARALASFQARMGWSRRQFAAELGMSQARIKRMLDGDVSIPRYIWLACQTLERGQQRKDRYERLKARYAPTIWEGHFMPDQNQQNQPQGGQKHKVTKQFTDQAGRTWKVGENFTGNAQAIQAAKSAGQIQESSGSEAE